MLTQDAMYSYQLSQLESFRSAAWGKNTFIKQSTRPSGSNTRTIEYLDLGKHHPAVHSFCHTAFNEKVTIFEEYRAAMRKFKEDDVGYKKGACIIGHPGIGKSCFVAYAVIERLREEQPVAVRVGSLEYHSSIWVFSDFNKRILTHRVFTFPNPADVRIFQITSPAKLRWKDWTKVRPYTMNVPSIEEVEDLVFVLGKDVERTKALAKKWGPVPRTLLLILEIPRAEVNLEREVSGAIEKAVRNPGSIFADVNGFDSSTTFSDLSRVFFIKPKPNTHRSLHFLYVPTLWLTSRLVDELIHKKEDVRAKFFNEMHLRSFNISDCTFMEIVRCFLARGEFFTIRWYDQEIGTGGPVLAVPLNKFGFKILPEEAAFGTDSGTSTGGGSDIAKEDYRDGDEYQNVRPSKRRCMHTDT